MSIKIRELSPGELDEMVAAEELDRALFQIPQHMKETLERYVQHRVQPGGFLEAVITNDLRAACARADLKNRRILFEYVQYLYNEAPIECWGSPEKYESWVRIKKSEDL